jgi:hypothetical protein
MHNFESFSREITAEEIGDMPHMNMSRPPWNDWD